MSYSSVKMHAPNVMVALMNGAMVACWTLASIVMATSPPRCIMPKIGGFSLAKVPRPRAPLRRFRRPSRPFFVRPQDVLYAQQSDRFHHIRHLLKASPKVSSSQSLLAVDMSSDAHRPYLSPVHERSADSTDSTPKSTGTGSTRAAVGDGRQKSSRSSHQRTARIACSDSVGDRGPSHLVPVSSPLCPDTWGRLHHQAIACDGRFHNIWHHLSSFECSASFTTFLSDSTGKPGCNIVGDGPSLSLLPTSLESILSHDLLCMRCQNDTMRLQQYV